MTEVDGRAWFLKELDPATHFHRLFDSMPGVLFFVKDVDGRLLFADRGLLELYGMESEEDLLGRTDFDFLPQELAEKYRRDDLQIMGTGEPALGMVELFLSPQGIPRWHVTDKLAARATDGRVIGVMGTIRPHADGGEGLLDGRLQPAIDHMKADLTRDDTIQDLASLCGMSVRQFENRFKSVYKISPSTFRIRLRLTRACELLQESDIPISEVALESGFYDQSALARQFRAILGITPLSFRRRYSR